jgi:hypothetical protein
LGSGGGGLKVKVSDGFKISQPIHMKKGAGPQRFGRI